MFGHIVPCGIRDRGVTSMAAILGDAPAMRAVVDAVTAAFARHFDYDEVDFQAVSPARFTVSPPSFGVAEPAHSCLSDAKTQKRVERPAWMRVKADLGVGFRETQRLMRGLELHTVCEEAGCPNIYECWADRTATFMILGDRCTRACGFCLVDTRKPLALDPDEPARVADAVATLGLEHAVITSVARDDVRGRWRRGVRGDDRRGPGADARDHDRGPDPRLQGRRRCARRDLRGASRRVEPQPRDRRAPATHRAAVGALLPVPRAPRTREGRGAGHEVGDHPRPRRDRRRAARRDRGSPQRRRRHPHPRPVPATLEQPPARRPLVDPRRVRRPRRLRRAASASPTSSPGPSSAPATTPDPRLALCERGTRLAASLAR